MWILQGSEPEGGSFVFRLPPGTVKTIGRAARADFILDAALVSRVHCRLTARDERVEVEETDLHDVIFPAENKTNVEEDLMPEQIEGVSIHYVSTIEEVLEIALA